MCLLTSPKEYFKEVPARSFSDVFSAPDLSLSTIQQQKGLVVSRSVVIIPVHEVVNFFNVGKTMNADQVAVTVDLILETYGYMKIEDLKLCFRNAMLGRYGKQYDRLDGAIILEWLRMYDNERANAATDISISEANVHKGSTSVHTEGLFYDEYIKQLEIDAENGDEDAKKSLALAENLKQMLSKSKIKY